MTLTGTRPLRFLFAGGGTGGHLFPAIAIADRLGELCRDRSGAQIAFVGTRRGLEFRLGERLGYPLHLINVRGLVRTFTLKNLLVPFLLISALLKADSLIKKLVPDVVIGTGGYVALPVLKAAARRGIPTVLQEQNTWPGLTTRKLAGSAACIYLGFEEAARHLPPGGQVMVTGNPVRASVTGGRRKDALAKFGLDAGKKTVVVLGGSQGSRAINQAVLRSLKSGSLSPAYQLLWQTGKRDYREVTAQVGDDVKDHTLFPFADDMAMVYAAGDLAVARAGAVTLAELAACRLPSILVPYPYAAGDHQKKNAAAYCQRGFAELLDETRLGGVDILEEAEAYLASGRAGEARAALEEAGKTERPAVDVIAEDILELVAGTAERGGAC
jgi:UDP-N-acetylglucosamine--N-acetylmuramyl-(pentapeptide) pyrophosphoryl-undecaprenol N-acetylglucosamine transferase